MSIPASTLYLFPPVAWWRPVMHYTDLGLLIEEPFRKMSCRNRYHIATANGPLLLSVPVAGGRTAKAPLNEVKIDYHQDWQKQHWRSLFSAYGRAPFFEHYGPALNALLHQEYPLLADLSLAALNWVKAGLRISVNFQPSAGTPQQNVRNTFAEGERMPRYTQVFDDRHGFLPNLSILDLLMNEGPAARQLLMQ